jgi:hypothetical protein
MNKNTLPQFSFYKAPISNNTPSGIVTLPDLYEAITGEHYAPVTERYRAIEDPREANDFKTAKFDYVTFCGVFSKRKDDAIETYSGYIVLDIDKQPNVLPIKERLISDTILDPQLIFISPGSKGLKVVVEYDFAGVHHAKESDLKDIWQVANEYLRQQYSDIIKPDSNGNLIDPSGKDLSRACFICHDPKCFINPKNLKNDRPKFYKNVYTSK